MKIDYKVHSVTQGPARVPAVVEGQETTAVVDCVQVELVSANPRHGAVTLRYIANERAGAADLFTADAEIEVTFSRK